MRRVLVVDDHPDSAETFAHLLGLLGHEATAVTDPRLVLELVEQLEPDIVFLDINMPGINGWQLAAMLRKDYSPKQVSLVAVTAYGETSDRIRSRQAGFDAHVLKPVSIPLVKSIIETLGHSR
jgi:CheY-like chemotaxis protein